MELAEQERWQIGGNLHYYGNGPALTLAQGFRAALDELGKHGKTLNMAAMKRNK